IAERWTRHRSHIDFIPTPDGNQVPYGELVESHVSVLGQRGQHRRNGKGGGWSKPIPDHLVQGQPDSVPLKETPESNPLKEKIDKLSYEHRKNPFFPYYLHNFLVALHRYLLKISHSLEPSLQSKIYNMRMDEPFKPLYIVVTNDIFSTDMFG